MREQLFKKSASKFVRMSHYRR